MKIISAQGHFGTMDGRRIKFEDGLNVLYLPNEGGKTTLCDFIRVMLYGLNTARRDSKNQLSDKTKYRPADGSPMSGVLEIEWKQRRIVLSRQTGKGGPMQEFSARYADTGEECQELTSRECGQRLTGVGEEGFKSSALIDGLDQSVSASELSERILALSTTGDSAMMYSRALTKLDRWKTQLKGSGGHGRYAEVEKELEQSQSSLQRLGELEQEIGEYEKQLPAAQQQIAQQEQTYRSTYERFMVLFVGKREEAERKERSAREEAARQKAMLPDFKQLKQTEKTIAEYDAALEDVQKAQDEYEDITENYERYRTSIDQTEEAYDASEWGESDIHIRWWSMALAVLFVGLAVLSFLHLIPVSGIAGMLLPYIFSVVAIVFLIITYLDSTKTLDPPPMDFDTERRNLERRRASAPARPQQAEQRVQEIGQQLVTLAAEIGIASEDIAAIRAGVAQYARQREAYFLQKQEHELLSERYLDILEATGPNGEERQKLNQVERELKESKQQEDSLKQSIAVCRGRCEEIGTREELLKQQQALREEHSDILWKLDAIAQARQALVRVNAELTGRMAPQINQLAQRYMQTLTADKYTALQLYTNFEAVCRADNSAVELDRLRLSSGTRDQLYLALRLAACTVLLDTRFEKTPLIMDDPFLTYDDKRAACAMTLLRELAYERQIILMTCRKPA